MMQLNETFNNVVTDYDYSRPKYPDQMFADINRFSGIKPGKSLLLEVGAGTGQATDYYEASGFHVTALEIGDRQIQYLNRKYKESPKISIVQSRFEDYTCQDCYDLIYSATAFHWIDPAVGYPKAYEMLKERGTMAVFWQMSSVTLMHGSIHDGLNQIKRQYMPDKSIGYDEKGFLQIKEKRIREIQTGGWFQNPEYHEYRWVDQYDADRYAALLNTYSDVQLLDESLRLKYLEEVKNYVSCNGGVVEMPQCVCLYLVKKQIQK